MKLEDGAPRTYQEWIDKGYDITPCKNKKPFLKDWHNKTLTKEDWKQYSNCQIGLKLKDLVDIDIDNHVVRRFIGYWLKTDGAVYGRKSNPNSHYLIKAECEPKKYIMPQELAAYCKGFPHGNCLLEIRSGKSFQSIVPASINEGEDVEWNKFANINSYSGDLKADIGKIALATALSILFPKLGNRDEYMSAIAGVLDKHSPWDEGEINHYCFQIAMKSGSSDPERYMSKGTNAKNPKTKNFGMPKLAEILNCSIKTISQLFAWIGVENFGGAFSELIVYETDPKYWQLKYKDKWITVYDSSHLLSYTKVSIHILENCYEVAPPMSPKDWKDTIAGLLKNVTIKDAPKESSYYGSIGGKFVNWLQTYGKIRRSGDQPGDEDIRWVLGDDTCCLHKEHYYFKLEWLFVLLKRHTLSYEVRKLTHFLRTEFKAEDVKVTVKKKQVRAWRVLRSIIDNHIYDNRDSEGVAQRSKDRLDKIERETGTRYGVKTGIGEIPF
jgi:hypothetical protein